MERAGDGADDVRSESDNLGHVWGGTMSAFDSAFGPVGPFDVGRPGAMSRAKAGTQRKKRMDERNRPGSPGLSEGEPTDGPGDWDLYGNAAGKHQFLNCEELFQDFLIKHRGGKKLAELEAAYTACLLIPGFCTPQETLAAEAAVIAERDALQDLADELVNGQCTFEGGSWWFPPL